jgi:hypothetical protein
MVAEIATFLSLNTRFNPPTLPQAATVIARARGSWKAITTCSMGGISGTYYEHSSGGWKCTIPQSIFMNIGTNCAAKVKNPTGLWYDTYYGGVISSTTCGDSPSRTKHNGYEKATLQKTAQACTLTGALEGDLMVVGNGFLTKEGACKADYSLPSNAALNPSCTIFTDTSQIQGRPSYDAVKMQLICTPSR